MGLIARAGGSQIDFEQNAGGAPAVVRAAARLVSNARLGDLDCGHAPFLELPDAHRAAPFDLLGTCAR
jgi:hypothetical protein